MNERELLTLAAKACGYVIVFTSDGRSWTKLEVNGRPALYTYPWHPLSDPGDCQRMGALLGIDVFWFLSSVEATKALCTPPINVVEYFSDHNGDKLAASMMASCRVAAEIGRSLT